MQDIYSLLLWIIPGAIMMRVLAVRTGRRNRRETGDLDLLVSYVIASVPVYGLVKAIAWGVQQAGAAGFAERVLTSKAWFVSISWPAAVFLGLAVAPMWKRFGVSRAVR